MNPDKLHAAVEIRQSRRARRDCCPLGVIVEPPDGQVGARAGGLRAEPKGATCTSAQVGKTSARLQDWIHTTGEESRDEEEEEEEGEGEEEEEDVPCSLAGGELLLTLSG